MERPTIREVITFLETVAPKSYQESYDNCGLLTGQPDWAVTGVLTTLDCTEAVVAEAIERKCNLIVSHHPIIFKGLKKITGQNYVERTVIKAIKNDIALYAIHTNLDNVYLGVNKKISDKLGLVNCKVLVPRVNSLSKLVTFVPTEYSASVLAAIHQAGAGGIGNYKNCSFTAVGKGTFLPTGHAKPTVGEIGRQETVNEHRIEVILPSHQERQVIDALKKSHPYEEVAYYLSSLSNENNEVGAGMIGELKQPEEPTQFLVRLKTVTQANVVRHTHIPSRPIKKVALCGGSGSFLVPNAIRAGADVYVSADFKYHEFFDADNQLLIADIGHFESEQFTKELLQEVLTRKFPTFAINFSITPTNPISYL